MNELSYLSNHLCISQAQSSARIIHRCFLTLCSLAPSISGTVIMAFKKLNVTVSLISPGFLRQQTRVLRPKADTIFFLNDLLFLAVTQIQKWIRPSSAICLGQSWKQTPASICVLEINLQLKKTWRKTEWKFGKNCIRSSINSMTPYYNGAYRPGQRTPTFHWWKPTIVRLHWPTMSRVSVTSKTWNIQTLIRFACLYAP